MCYETHDTIANQAFRMAMGLGAGAALSVAVSLVGLIGMVVAGAPRSTATGVCRQWTLKSKSPVA